jgi:hypothetical protein
MEIQSAFNAGVQGFQQASEDADKAASQIAQRNTVDRQAQEQQDQQQVQQRSPAEQARQAGAEQPPAITDSLINLKVAEAQARNSVAVIKTADENLGTLIDTRV